jgi:Reverse transcriptase (RNA-dependent DNA polymerase)
MSCVYSLHDGEIEMYIALYVDDLLIFTNSLDALVAIKAELTERFEMTDLGEAQYVLGIQIERDRANRTLSIGQREYIRRIVDHYRLSDSKPSATPLEISTKLSKTDSPTTTGEQEDMKNVPYLSAIGEIMYAMLGTRPDIAYAVTILSQFSSNPGRRHWEAVKRLLRYLCGTMDFRLQYGAAERPANSGSIDEPLSVWGYCDSDWASNVDDRRSITGYTFLAAGAAVSWQTKKQPTVALSTVEAEYMSASRR